MKKAAIGYVLMAVLSWFLISGWEFAETYDTAIRLGYYSSQISTPRHDAGFACAYGTVAVFWPISLPVNYAFFGFAEHGWRPVWKF